MAKYLSIPIHLIEFWYPEATIFFVRTWKNLMLYLEEDLAAGLMWRLLFTPLFHDATIVGHVLSFLFRVIRIIFGLFGFFIATVLLLAIGGYWLIIPVLTFLNTSPVLDTVTRILFFGGLGLFLIHIFGHPHKKVWQTTDLWLASTVKKENLKFAILLQNKEVQDLLANLELQLDHLPNWDIQNADEVGKKAFDLAKTSGSEYIGPRHFFVAALKQIPNIDNMLLKLDLKISDFDRALKYMETKIQTWRSIFIWDDEFTVHHLKGVNRGWLGVPTPNLDLYSEDLTKDAATKGFADLIRENGKLSEVVNILSQQTGRNVILVGPPGSGKTAFIRYLAQQIVTGNAPPALATKRLVMLDLTKLLSGIKTQGELAERVKAIFEEVAFAQNIIFVVDEIHELGLGEVGTSLNLYSLMQPYLESDTFQFIGITEEENYSRILEKNGFFARIFRKVEIEPATPNDSLKILQYRAIEAERNLKVKVSLLAIKSAVELSQKLIYDRCLPDSAIAVLKEALTRAVNGWVTKDVIKRVISQRVKVPLMDIGTADKQKLLNLESQIHSRLIDQEQAVKAVSDSLRRAATGLGEDGRPIGSFLFVGPTGVGKTELAKTLADVYFTGTTGGKGITSTTGNEPRDTRDTFDTRGTFIRFDMSEYQNPESVVRLIGGAGEGGLLTESVRNRPYGLILLDELEKANDKILTLFLQVLDDGRLTDGAGRVVSFENTIIIATSNAGSLLIAEGLDQGKTLESLERGVNDELLKEFSPELVNRFDEVVLFKSLAEADLEKIVKLKLAALQTQMKEKGYLIEFDRALLEELAKRGFDPVLGARPLRRLIQDSLEANLSRMILEGNLKKGIVFRAGVELLG
ncbi:MAG: ATP-dependent Clp protease ATP-binding subunit ClpC [Microgenomates group bacterium Gr01-1014_7]|nr:MAG: ATP-dependent Clp protease ATP-binding subunit ClpC [Microgenomates group bacterium Gr01-1014_7]